MIVTVASIDPVTGLASERSLEVPAGITFGKALAAAGVPDGAEAALNNDRVPPDEVLHAGDRIDLLCPLQLDAKDARRVRAEARRRAENRTWGRHGGRHQLHRI